MPESLSNVTSVEPKQVVFLFYRNWKKVARAFFISALLSVGLSFIIPSYFKSTTVLIPEMDKSKLMGLGGLGDLAALAGVNVGESSIEKLMPTIIKSEAILVPVLRTKYRTKEFADSVDLITYYDLDSESGLLNLERGLKLLRNELDVVFDRQTNVLTISFSAKEPMLAADVLHVMVSELDKLIRERRRTRATEQRLWIEGRLRDVKLDLEHTEVVLKDFREKNRRVIDSPNLQLDQARMMREVEINNTLFIELKKQFEIIRIEEIKNIPIINILDEARPAAKKDRPSRSIIVLVGTALGTLGMFGSLIARTFYQPQVNELKEWFRPFQHQ